MKETILNASYKQANPFSYGAGHIQPNKAADPGLVYDLGIKDYLSFLCASGYNTSQMSTFSNNASSSCANHINLLNFNYPSITIPKLSRGSTTILTRTLKNVGTPPTTYRVNVVNPKGMKIGVKPRRLKFNKIGEEQSFTIRVSVETTGRDGGYVFGELIWSDTTHHVRSPIVVRATP